MSRAAALAFAGFAAIAGSVSCSNQPQREDDFRPAPQAEAREILFSASPAAASVVLGGDVVVKCSVKNTSTVPFRANLPRLSEDSVSFRVRGAGHDAAWIQKVLLKEREKEPALCIPPETRELAPGESVESEIRFPAVLAGSLVITATYRCQSLESVLASKPFELSVTPDGESNRVAVKFTTSHGEIVGLLRSDLALNTCTAFAGLVKRGFYDGLKFHRVVQGFMAQGGDPEGAGWGGPGYQIRRELHGKLPHRRGIWAMARQNIPDTAGSQFYICFGPQPNLDDAGYTTFAETITGEETLARIERVGAPPTGAPEVPSEPITIRKAELVLVRR